MRHYVYILKNTSHGNYYIGSTSKKPEERLKGHNEGKTEYTRHRRPWDLVFYQEYSDITEARKIEQKLKRFRNKNIIERIVQAKKITTKTD